VASVTSVRQESERTDELRKTEEAEAKDRWKNIVTFCKAVRTFPEQDLCVMRIWFPPLSLLTKVLLTKLFLQQSELFVDDSFPPSRASLYYDVDTQPRDHQVLSTYAL